MNGILALQGGGPFAANDALDRRLLTASGATRAVVLPTADAFERPDRLVAAAMNWGERLDVEVEALMVMRRGEAMESGPAEIVRQARAVYLVGDQPLHLRSVLKGTPLWQAITEVMAEGGVVVATGGSAAAMCDPMVDPRGGAFTLGLGLVVGLGPGDRGRDVVERPPASHPEAGQHPARRATQWIRSGAHRAGMGTDRRHDGPRRTAVNPSRWLSEYLRPTRVHGDTR